MKMLNLVIIQKLEKLKYEKQFAIYDKNPIKMNNVFILEGV